MRRVVFLCHAGAGRSYSLAIQREVDDFLDALAERCYRQLCGGVSSKKVCVQAVQELEDFPLVNAGKGSAIQSDGKIRVSAGLMDGRKQIFSGVVNANNLKNAILCADKLQKMKDHVLASQEAVRWAKSQGLKTANLYTPQTLQKFKMRRQKVHGTVGAVALDSSGFLSAATSTGGKGFEIPGRVSDTPTIASTYANHVAAISATGIGEHIVNMALAPSLITRLELGQSMSSSVGHILKVAKQRRYEFGFILLNHRGEWAAPHTTPHMSWQGFNSKGYLRLR